ncbi:CRISPR-associated helicase Cas3' [Coraliomargarita algicola]|uniref:CRISPR-associated helicase Cas3 n=1 Tax=Coraliomargarita algicola TaxID=3092156 RepID=A0ABZ0RJF6_9BACT|nr:CRISPR-associated helicase Cas3' [Coraliomargarita sp. J2-16]WPJ95667.1 CRISPR-associated helicase Cas3' [Coraliomargarita sp. J2-16]
MKDFTLNDCWAKTDPETGQPCLSVTEHCKIVGSVAETLLSRLPPLVANQLPQGSVALVAAHDIGKLTPGFQLKAPLWPWHQTLKESIIADSLTTNHAIVSQWHLQNHSALRGNKKSQYWLVSTGGHHGSYPLACRTMKQAPYEGGNNSFLQLRNELTELLIQSFGSLPLEIAKHEFERIHLLTGFTIFSDWIGSNADWFPANISTDDKSLRDRSHEVLDSLRWNPRIHQQRSFGHQFTPQAPETFSPRPIQSALLEAADSPGLYIVEAPMGMGKTEAALTTAYQRWTQGDERGLYFALPTQLTSNKIHDRITTFLENILDDDSTQTLIHGNTWLGDKKSQTICPAFKEMNPDQPENEANDINEALRWYSSTRKQLMAPFGTGTIDQALLAVLPARFAALRYFALAGKVVVIDEVHSFDPYMSALIDRLIRYLIKAGSTVIILSATLTAQRRAELVQAAGASERSQPQDYPLITKVPTGSTHATHVSVPYQLAPQTVNLRHQHMHPDIEDEFWESIADKVEAGANVVVIRNTVALAQNTYRQLKARLSSRIPDENIGLLHSRFPQNERQTNEDYWTGILGKDDAKRPQGSLLVSTQIVEQSVDIDADCLITDLAPTELILQRIGRLHRHQRPRPAGFEQATCYILHPSTDWEGDAETVKDALSPHHWIYPPLTLWQAAQTLAPLSTIQLPQDIRPLLEQAASCQVPAKASSALCQFHDEHSRKRSAMHGTAALRDVFNASAIDDNEGTETRYGIKPSALLIILPSAPVEQGGNVIWQLPDGSTETHRVGEFNYPLAKALQTHATRIPAYLVKAQLSNCPDWLKQHIESGVLAVQADDSSELQLVHNSESATHTLSYRHDLGISYEKNESISHFSDPEDFWF